MSDCFTVVSKHIAKASGIAEESFDGISVTMEDGTEIWFESIYDLGLDFTWSEPETDRGAKSTFQLINKEFGGIGEVSILFGVDNNPYFIIWFDRDCANDLHSESFEYRDLEEMMKEWEVI